MNHPQTVSGDYLGLSFPTTIEPLLQQGTGFLTDALRVAQTLSSDNRITAITASQEFVGGGMGRKLWIAVEYARAEPGLHHHLFVKFPRNFGDPLRELFAPLMQPEVRFALLSRREGFPIAVPRCYFADYNAQTQSGILITERIMYGQDGVEPCHEKCKDYVLTDPLGHYQSLARTMARLAAHHKAGRFGAEVDQQFPFDPTDISANRIPYNREQLAAKLDKLQVFADEHRRLLPGPAGAANFLKRFAAEAALVLELEVAIRRRLNADPRFIALCHWNMNLDNAWFWRDPAGEIHAGLLDWGSVGQMNVAQAFYGMTCAAETDFLKAHRRGLMALFVDEFRSHGGPAIDVDELEFLFKLSVAVLGIAWILDAPALVEAQIPDLHVITDRRDPKLAGDFLARAQLQLLNVFLSEWLETDIGSALNAFAAQSERNPHP